MKRTMYCLTAVCSFALVASWAYAEPKSHGESQHDEGMSREQMHERMGKRHFKEMDTNGDKMISKAEFDAAHNKHFQEMDATGDGSLNSDEMKAGHKKAMGKAAMEKRGHHRDEKKEAD